LSDSQRGRREVVAQDRIDFHHFDGFTNGKNGIVTVFLVYKDVA
jgi:hypothetical protein